MLHVCVSRRLPGHDPERIEALGADETLAAWRLHVQGVFHALHFDAAQNKGVVLIEAANANEARAALARLPVVRGGQIDFDVVALGPYARLETQFA
ncbi:MAG TPA: hypothetical protein VMU47_01385 [Caldimonas sp.]|nr:hypothetical protein [Caldimonas sp.]